MSLPNAEVHRQDLPVPSDGPKLSKYWSPNLDSLKTSEAKTQLKSKPELNLFPAEQSFPEKRTIQEYLPIKLNQIKPTEMSTHSTLAVSKSIDRQKSPPIDPKIYKKNSYEVFKLLKAAIRKYETFLVRVGFRRMQRAQRSEAIRSYLPILPVLRKLVIRWVLKRRKSNPLFKSKFAELNDLKILAKRFRNGNGHSALEETIRLLQEDLKYFIFNGRFCYDQKMIDEKVQNCLESEANSETPQVLASESVSSIQGNLKLIKKKLIHNESFKDYSNTLNQSSQMTNADQSTSFKGMFKKFKKNNLSESRCYHKPKIESAKINFINIKSRVDCWNLPPKKGRITTESESQITTGDSKDLVKLRERFKNQYSKPFLKSIKKLDNLDNELSMAKSRAESVNVYQNKLIPKVSFNEPSIQIKKSASKAREFAFKPTYESVKVPKFGGGKSSLKTSVVINPPKPGDPKPAVGDKLSFEEIKDTYLNKYLTELGKLFEKAVDRQATPVDNFDPKRLVINDQPFTSMRMVGNCFTEVSAFLNRKFDRITNA